MIQQKALTRLLVKKEVFSKEDFLEMVKARDQKIRRKRETS